MSINFSIHESIIESFTPRVRYLPSEWAEKFVYLPRSVSNVRYGYVVLQQWQRDIIDTLDDFSFLKTRVVRSAAQTGKTTLLCLVALYNAFVVEQQVMIAIHSIDAGEKLMENLRAIILASPELKKLYLKGKGKQTKDTIRLKNGIKIVRATLGSGATLRSSSCGCVILDEVDAVNRFIKDEGSLIAIAEARTNSFPDTANIWIASTPTTPDGNISLEYEKSRSHTWSISCPVCGSMQALDHNQIRWRKDCSASYLENHKDEIYYKCNNCGEKYYQKRFRKLIENGSFVIHEDQEEKDQSIIGYHISGLISAAKTLYTIAKKYREALLDRTQFQSFFNLEIGKVFNAHKQRIENKDIVKNIIDGLESPNCPANTMAVSIGIDIGRKESEGDYHFYYVAVALQPNSKYTVFDSIRITGEEKLKEYITRPIITEDKRRVHPSAIWIDSGFDAGNYVYDLVSRIGHPACAVKGVNRNDSQDILRISTNKEQSQPLALIHKDRSFHLFFQLMKESSLKFVCNLPPEFYKHIQTWTYDSSKRKYVEIVEDSDDHSLDALRYALVSFQDSFFRNLRSMSEDDFLESIKNREESVTKPERKIITNQVPIPSYDPHSFRNIGGISPW